jgi:site-specific recombinase XerD
MRISVVTMGQLEDFLETIASKYTRKNYVNGIKKFEEWYGDSITKLVKSPEATKTVEKFYVALKQKHPQNTCRNVTNSAIQFLKYFGTDVRPRRALGIYRTEKAIDDHRLTIEEVQKMAAVADLREQVMLQVLLLGLRIADAITLKVSDLDKLEQPAPIELNIRASKGSAGTVYETFICQEFKELLGLYLPTLNGKWLFQAIRKNGHIKDETLNTTLRDLSQRAGIQLHGKLHWHCGRKLVMTTGAELGLNTWIIKKMLGKRIPLSDDTYLYTDIREGFLKLRSVLCLTPRVTKESLSDVEELTNICSEAIATSLKPTIRKMLIERMVRNGIGSQTGNQTLGFIELPNIDAMSNKQLLELYVKLKREEKESD